MGRSHDTGILESEISPFKKMISPLHFSNDISLLSSPQKRCIQTAEIFKTEKSITPGLVIDNAFIEVDYGDFEGKSLSEIKDLFPQAYTHLVNTPSKLEIPNGESFLSVQERAFSRLTKILEESNNDIAIFTHVDIIKFIIFRILNISIDMKKQLYIENGSISCLEYTNGYFKLKYMNMNPQLFNFSMESL